MTEFLLEPKKFQPNCLVSSFLCRPLGSWDVQCSFSFCQSVLLQIEATFAASPLVLCPQETVQSAFYSSALSPGLSFSFTASFSCSFVCCFVVDCPVNTWYLLSLSLFQYVSTKAGERQAHKNKQTGLPQDTCFCVSSVVKGKNR